MQRKTTTRTPSAFTAGYGNEQAFTGTMHCLTVLLAFDRVELEIECAQKAT
jgi:hypothetical protein